MNIAEIGIQDLRTMFQNTLVRYNNNPVMITHINNNKKADCVFIGNNDEQTIPLDDEKFNFKPVSLGYVNIQGYCVYLSRTTRRQYKQGLCIDNAKFKLNGGDLQADRQHAAYERVKQLTCKAIHNTVKNVYPSLQNAIEMFEDEAHEVAFDRQFSVNKYGRLYYKAEPVGDVNLQTHEIVFPPEFEYLRKAL